MNGAIDANAKPLPVVLKAARDELLSSWLARHARFYGVTGSFFAKWLGLGDFRLSALDYRLGLEQVARLTEKFRCDPVTLIRMIGRRPTRSAIKPNTNAPIGRIASVQKNASATADTRC